MVGVEVAVGTACVWVGTTVEICATLHAEQMIAIKQ
jgi:hypothetical protein